MNRKTIDTRDVEQQSNGEYAVHRSYRTNIFAAVICLLLAFVVWIAVMTREDSDYVPARVLDPKDGYTYTLSAIHLEVEGTVADLRHADVIGVHIPEGAEEGVFELTEDDLELPEGVHLAGSLDLTLTVEKK
ncbi:MAG: hypothetical protein IJX39_05510 [Clostridia bacterium]|nr:hypothetical protein [Clostridia bacterium]